MFNHQHELTCHSHKSDRLYEVKDRLTANLDGHCERMTVLQGIFPLLYLYVWLYQIARHGLEMKNITEVTEGKISQLSDCYGM